MTKKDGGSFLVRDFTDEIYNANPDPTMFVDAHNSQVFTNMVVVIPKGKLQQFNEDARGLMNDYYTIIDATETKRMPDVAKNIVGDYEDMDQEALAKLAEKLGTAVPDKSNIDDFKAFIVKHLEHKLKEKQGHRIPGVIVPECTNSLNLMDKDSNELFRIVVYKPQVEDVQKALRRKGYVAKEFSYDKKKWQDDNEKRQLLQEEEENKKTTLN